MILVITTVYSMLLELEVQRSILTSHSNQRKDLIHQRNPQLLEYSTTATQVDGPIDSVQIISRGKNYTEIPVVASIASTSGVGGAIRLVSKNIGVPKTFTIKNVGFDYSADKTLEPSVLFPQILKLDRLSKVSNIGITSGGKNYLTPPTLIFIDRITGETNTDIVTRTELQSTSVNGVELLRNTNRLFDSSPLVVATNNSNGFKVSDVSYQTSTRTVTLTLESGTVGFSTSTYPFTIGEKIFVEQIGINPTW